MKNSSPFGTTLAEALDAVTFQTTIPVATGTQSCADGVVAVGNDAVALLETTAGTTESGHHIPEAVRTPPAPSVQPPAAFVGTVARDTYRRTVVSEEMELREQESPDQARETARTRKALINQMIRAAATTHSDLHQRENGGDEIAAAFRRFYFGSLRGSKVKWAQSRVTISSFTHLLDLIRSLGDCTGEFPIPNTDHVALMFAVPKKFVAYTTVIRLRSLLTVQHHLEYSATSEDKNKSSADKRDRKLNRDEVCAQVRPFITETNIKLDDGETHKVVTTRLHAPSLRPVITETVTFVLTKDHSKLIQWHAGPDIRVFPANGDLGANWVVLGRGLLDEFYANKPKPQPQAQPAPKPEVSAVAN